MNAIERGVALFNAREFWLAHEAWEQQWLTSSGDEKQFLQGLIQLAAAYHHLQRGTFSGGVRLFDAALRRLASFPPGYLGVFRDDAVRSAALHRQLIADGQRVGSDELPKLRYN